MQMKSDGLNTLETRVKTHRPVHLGREVCWRQTGDGPPLVLLHGGHGSWLHWVRNVEALATSFTVWAPDMPGYGDSDTPPLPDGASLVEMTLATLNQLVGDKTPICIVGFSFGALVAAHLAAQRQAVVGLALLGAAGHGGQRRPTGKLRAWRGAVDSGDARALAELMRHNLGVHMLHDPAHIDDVAVGLHTRACLQTRFHSKTISRSNGLMDLLDQCNTPLLLVWGEHDVTAQPEVVARSLSENRPNCVTHVIPDAGHWAQYEQAEVVNRLLIDWLDTVRPAR